MNGVLVIAITVPTRNNTMGRGLPVGGGGELGPDELRSLVRHLFDGRVFVAGLFT